jgi:hypothetical protein
MTYIYTSHTILAEDVIAVQGFRCYVLFVLSMNSINPQVGVIVYECMSV